MDKWDRLNFETKLSLHHHHHHHGHRKGSLIEMEWNVEMILFVEEENLRRPLERGWEIATNSSHEIMNSRTENQTCTIVKVVSRDIAKPQLLAQFSG